MASNLLKGYWPYINAVENNFPGTTLFIHFPEFILFGRSVLAFHAWDILWQLAGTFFLYKIIEQISNRLAAWLVSVLTAIYYLSVDNLMVAQRDCYAAVILLAVLFIMLSRKNADGSALNRYFWCGLLYGAAILIRPTNELLSFYLAAWLIYDSYSRAGIKNGIIFFASSQFLLCVYILIAWITGSLNEVYTIVIRFNTEVYSSLLPILEVLNPLGKYWILLIAVPFGFATLRKQERILISGLVIAAIITIIPQKRYVYQYYPVFILLFVFAGVGWTWLFSRIKSVRLQGFLIVFITVSALLFYTRGTSQKRIFIEAIAGNLPNTPIYWQYDTSSTSGFAALDSVGVFLQSHTTPNDRVQFIGEYVYPLYYANRLSATRFIIMAPLVMRGSNGLTAYQLRWRKEFADMLSAHPPIYIVVADAPDYARGHLNGNLGHEILEKDLTEVGECVSLHYHPEAKIGAFTFYRRN
jgi:hypothetical protein